MYPKLLAVTSHSALGKHTFCSDGLLQVNTEGAHFVFELISRADMEWEAKL
jgi:hypothetical protein